MFCSKFTINFQSKANILTVTASYPRFFSLSYQPHIECRVRIPFSRFLFFLFTSKNGTRVNNTRDFPSKTTSDIPDIVDVGPFFSPK